MAIRVSALLVVTLTLPALALARSPHVTETPRGLHVNGRPLETYDLPLAQTGPHARGAIDTIWWGNTDAWGVAIPGGTWDFEGGPLGVLQGWTSIDLTDIQQTLGVLPVRRVTSGTFGAGDVDATITEGGSTASLWFGALDAEARPYCWPGGQGYSNDWGLYASRAYTWGGSGDVTIDVDYFVDSETQFDYTYVYVENSDGQRSEVLNESANGRPDDGKGWSGSVQEMTEIGSPAAPEHETMTVDEAFLAGAVSGPEFTVLINFDSDPLYSDGLDSFAGFLNSVYGPAGLDDIHVTGSGLDHLSDFESGTDGWTFSSEPPIGNFMKVRALGELEPPAESCQCPLSGNVLLAASLDGSGYPHPLGQEEAIESPPAYVGADASFGGRLISFDTWMDLTTEGGVGYRVAMDYYPWTCPSTNIVGWTIEPLDQGGGYFFNNSIGGQPGCVNVIRDNTNGMPADVDSIRIVFELLQQCPQFCCVCVPAQINQSPYWDNVRLGAYGLPATAPLLTPDVLYQDVYPQTNTLVPSVTVDIHSEHDNNRADGNPTNANLGDSAVVMAGTEPSTEVYLNFRVYPGPSTNVADPWFAEYGGNFLAPGGGWAKARMDTAEVGGIDGDAQVVLGAYSTYDYPHGQENMALVYPASSDQKILEDGVLTPGSTVEYFFSGNGTTTPGEQSFFPDTTGETYLEMEVLPGYFEVEGLALAPCLLYVDAYNNGAQAAIQDHAIRNLVGEIVDDDGLVHDHWDRYDYLGAGSNTAAPLAREVNGDNGMTHYQSMLYKTILYNTGTFSQEGLRDGDAALLMNFLTSDDFHRPSIDKGLWLSGNGIGGILSRPGRLQNNLLLAEIASAALVCDAYNEAGCTQAAGGDSSYCVRLDEAGGATLPQSVPFAVTGNGCPSVLDFDVFDAVGTGAGNLDYVDQDGGGTRTSFASVNNDTFDDVGRWGVVLDGFSVHYLRTYGGTMADCGDDSTAILDRAADVFAYLNVDQAPGVCDVDVSVGLEEEPVAIAVTRLFRNSPNPFNPQTTVRYQLHSDARVVLEIFDVSGRRVRTLLNGAQETGRYEVVWDGTAESGEAVGSGVYWVRMRTSLGFASSTKMVVLK